MFAQTNSCLKIKFKVEEFYKFKFNILYKMFLIWFFCCQRKFSYPYMMKRRKYTLQIPRKTCRGEVKNPPKNEPCGLWLHFYFTSIDIWNHNNIIERMQGLLKVSGYELKFWPCVQEVQDDNVFMLGRWQFPIWRCQIHKIIKQGELPERNFSLPTL